MSGTVKKKPIKNAVEIIEKFGGIRPMSAKTNVAVTTIQGWKKRDTIPAARRAVIIEAAANHNIDLSGLIDDAPPVTSKPSEPADIEIPDSIKEEKTEETASGNKAKDNLPEFIINVPEQEKASDKEEAPQPKAYTEIPLQEKERNLGSGAVMTALIALVIIAAVVMMFWPGYEGDEDMMASLDSDLMASSPSQTSFKGLVAENWSQQLDDLKAQIEHTRESLDETVESVKGYAQEHNLEERVVQLQSYVSEISGGGVYALLSRFESMEETTSGREMLDNSVNELTKLLSGANTTDESKINQLVEVARSSNESLGQTLENVPHQELKAASMLLAMTQIRGAFNRGDTSFDSDLKLLLNMVDEDNVELRAALEKLAPDAKSGVLTTNGISNEFRSLAGDVVAASLAGEEVFCFPASIRAFQRSAKN